VRRGQRRAGGGEARRSAARAERRRGVVEATLPLERHAEW